LSYNRWLYGYSNAVNFRDPSGNCPDGNGDGICDSDWSTCLSIQDPFERAKCFEMFDCSYTVPELETPPGLETHPLAMHAFETYKVLRRIGGWWNSYRAYELRPLQFVELLLGFELRSAWNNIDEEVLKNTVASNFYFRCDFLSANGGDVKEGLCGTLTDYISFRYIGDKGLLKEYQSPPGYYIRDQKGVKQADINRVWKNDGAPIDFSNAIAYPPDPSWKHWLTWGMPMEWGNLDSVDVPMNASIGPLTNQVTDKTGDGQFFILTYCQNNHFTRIAKDPATENVCILQDAGNY
jgi:hypothetical protein